MARKVFSIWKVAQGRGVERLQSGKSKPFSARLYDMLRWYLLHREVLYYYYIFRFDNRSHAEQDEYLSWREHDSLIEQTEKLLVDAGHPLDYYTVTFDKFVANKYLESIKISCARNEALIKRDQIFLPDQGEENLEQWLAADTGVYFIKPISSMGGKGIIRADLSAKQFWQAGRQYPISQLRSILLKGFWTVQKEIIQHPDLARFNPHAVNTLRIITILNNYKPEFFASFVRLSIGNSIVDNWDSGSLAIGIDSETGTMQEVAYYKPKNGIMQECYEHPESRLPFKDFRIPFYFETMQMCLKAHEYFYGTFIIGWDVAITETGPVILEANCRPTFHPLQMWYGGMRKKLQTIHQAYHQKRM